MTRIRPILLPLAAVVFGCGLALIVGRATPLAHATPLAQTAPLVQTAPPDAKLPAPLGRPTPQQAAWQDLEVGMFLHFGPQTWQDSEVDLMTTEPSAMNPEKLDTDQWVRVAESMGARILVFVAKHEGGFCWWQTGTTDFGVRNTPWRGGKGDVMADLAASCRTRGMRLGVYLSPQDRKHDVGVGGRAKDAARQAEYERLFRQQLTEVLTKYGEMTEVWFDGSCAWRAGRRSGSSERRPRCLIAGVPLTAAAETPFMLPIVRGAVVVDIRAVVVRLVIGAPRDELDLGTEVRPVLHVRVSTRIDRLRTRIAKDRAE
ncbi:MAG TPA: alpha-L-fucosidase [Vicinamibacterales bacterium]